MFYFLADWLRNKIIIAILTVIVIGQFIYMVKPGKETNAVLNEFILGESCRDAVTNLPDATNMPATLLLPLIGDLNDVVTNKLMELIREDGRYRLVEPSMLAKLKKEMQFPNEIVTLDDAHRLGQSLAVDRVLYGEVYDYAQGEDAAKVEFSLNGVDSSQATPAYFTRGVFGKNVKKDFYSMPYLKAQIRDSASGGRLIVWFLVVLTLPFITLLIVKSIIETESNVSMFMLLFAYTLIDALLAYILLGMGAISLYSAIFLLLAFALAGFYNYWACSAIKEYEG